MEVTPDIFEAQDRYNEAMTDSARQIAVLGNYGLLPDTEMSITTSIVEDAVSLKVHALEAVTSAGRLLQVDGDSFSRNLPHAKGQSCYIVVRRDRDVEQMVNGVVYAKPSFAYDYCTLDEIGKDCLPLSKLYMVEDLWKVQELYIPPCLSLNAHPWLMQCLAICTTALHRILDAIENKHKITGTEQLHLLLLELDEFTGEESPRQFYLLLKKAAWMLSTKHIEGIILPSLPPFLKFNNNDFLLSAEKVIDYIQSYLEIVTTEAEPQKEEPKVDYIVYDGIIP